MPPRAPQPPSGLVAVLVQAALFLTLSIGLAACKALPRVAVGDCGNAVIEAPEDCDTFAPYANAVCRPKGTAGQCRLDCRRRSDGTRPSCPSGWGCDLEGLCHAPTGQFEPPVTYKVGGAFSLRAADFDGDGRVDILSRGPLDSVGRSKLRFHYFDERAMLSETRLFPKLAATPLIVDLAHDGRSDVFFTEPRIGLLFGRADRAWIPEAFGSYRFSETAVRVFGVYRDTVENTTALVALSTLGNETGFFALDPETGELRLQSALPGPIDQLLGDPVGGDVISDPESSPCLELVFGLRGATTVGMIDMCCRAIAPRREAAIGDVIWRANAVETTLVLDPPAPLDVAPQITDMNGDGHLDVMVGAGGRIYVAYGDGKRLGVAAPFVLGAANPENLAQVLSELPMPLAAGDVSGDGFPDFVFPRFLMISGPTPGSPRPTYLLAHSNFAAIWTEARIVDLNGNGLPDIIAASSAQNDLDFFNGSGTMHLTHFSLPTSGPARHLAVEDLDGDLINDVAWVQSGSTPEDRDALSVAFGSPAGPPLAPAAIARVARADQVSAFRMGGIGNLTIASMDKVADKSTAVLTLVLGSGDRIPFAPYELTNFSATGSLQDWAPIALTAGSFTGPGHQDVLGLVTSDFQKDWQFWVLPDLGLATMPPQLLPQRLDPRLQPASGTSDADLRVYITSTSGDLDGDGREESVFAMPVDGAERCGVVVVGRRASAPDTFTVAPTLFLDEPCGDGEIVAVDADGDQRRDLVLLTGDVDKKNRKLLVIWNDGSGQFSPTAVTTISVPGQAPRAFIPLPPVAARRFWLVYVTDVAVMAVGAGDTPRTFAPAQELIAVQQGTGIAAGDVDGDGLTDLVLAAGGNLSVMKAQTRP